MNAKTRQILAAFCVPTVMTMMLVNVSAQVNPGSSGVDGAFNPTVDTVIDMADHPTGIYQYTSVNIPAGITVSFIPNASNTPIVWLVQNNVTVNGTVSLVGQRGSSNPAIGGAGGPGGWRGGNGSPSSTTGQGPGGGMTNFPASFCGSYSYGNAFLIPLLGGSGGGGATCGPYGGGGGGGVILIACLNILVINGSIVADGGNENATGFGSGDCSSGGGSGGAIRLVGSQIIGTGHISVNAGQCNAGTGGLSGPGRVRFDTYDNEFSGTIAGQFTQGSQFTLIPAPGQIPQLTVTSVGGVSVSASPTGVLSTPDAVLSAQQNNPIPVVVNCANLPLNSQVTVNVKPANGSPVSATGQNTTGTQTLSTATISIVMPRGGGLIYATAATSN